MTKRIPAEAFPPGEFLKDELGARNLTQEQFAEMSGLSLRTVSEIISDKRACNLKIAGKIASTLGTSAQLWMTLEKEWKFWKKHREGL